MYIFLLPVSKKVYTEEKQELDTKRRLRWSALLKKDFRWYGHVRNMQYERLLPRSSWKKVKKDMEINRIR